MIGVLALPGNLILIYISLFTKKMKMEGVYLLQNLALSDLLIVLIGVPFTLANLSTRFGMVKVCFIVVLTSSMLLLLFCIIFYYDNYGSWVKGF